MALGEIDDEDNSHSLNDYHVTICTQSIQKCSGIDSIDSLYFSFQKRKLRPRKVKGYAPSDTASKWQGGDLNTKKSEISQYLSKRFEFYKYNLHVFYNFILYKGVHCSFQTFHPVCLSQKV